VAIDRELYLAVLVAVHARITPDRAPDVLVVVVELDDEQIFLSERGSGHVPHFEGAVGRARHDDVVVATGLCAHRLDAAEERGAGMRGARGPERSQPCPTSRAADDLMLMLVGQTQRSIVAPGHPHEIAIGAD